MEEFSREELADLLRSLKQSFSFVSPSKPRHRGRRSDGDQDSVSLFEHFIRAIPSFLGLLDTLDSDSSVHLLARRNDSLLEQLHSFSSALDKTREEKEELFSALEESEKKQDYMLKELKRTQSLAADLKMERDKKKEKAKKVKKKLIEDEQKTVKQSEAVMTSQLQLSQENHSLRSRLATYTVRISTLKAKNSYLKLSLSKSTQRITELESAVTTLVEQLSTAERHTEELDIDLSRSEKKARILEEELSIHNELSIKETLEDVSSPGDSEADHQDFSFREEIELSARLNLGETSEEQLFSPRTSYIRLRLPQEFEPKKPHLWSERGLRIENRITDVSITHEKAKSLCAILYLFVMWVIFLWLRLLFHATVTAIQVGFLSRKQRPRAG